LGGWQKEYIKEMQPTTLDTLYNLALSILSGGAAGAFIIWLLKDWISERLAQSIKHQYDEKLARYTTELQAESEKKIEMYRYEIRQAESVNQERWRIKRGACLKALNIANALLSNYKYQGLTKEENEQIVKQNVTTSEVRECFNELACSCDTPDVMNELKKIALAKVSPDAIVDLRSAVRRELGFGNDVIDTDRITSFIGKVGADPSANKE
jgi:hypothetical protein